MNYRLASEEIQVLRELALQYAEAASLPVNDENRRLWTKNNDLHGEKPMVIVMMGETPWNELNVNDELTNRCTSEFGIELETYLRRWLYTFRHMPCDMVLEPYIPCKKLYHSTGYGIQGKEEAIQEDKTSQVASHHYLTVIDTDEDIDRIQTPQVTSLTEETQEKYDAMCAVFDGILPVKLVGHSNLWFAPWDWICMWRNPSDVMIDLMDRPEFSHRLVEKVIDAFIGEVEQMEALGLLDVGNVGTDRVGYTNDLSIPKDGHSTLWQSWGLGAAQIFSEVSPAMQKEFAIDHEIKYYERCGLNYYGCCEPLHNKVDISRTIPRLRKISMSPWANIQVAAEACGKDLVISRKPNPALVGASTFEPEAVEKETKETLDACRKYGCNVELILKDISTVNYKPQVLWEWARIVTEICREW